MKTKTIIVDIDGTIADDSHRQHFLKQEPKQWKNYFDNCKHDKPIESMCSLVKMLEFHFNIVYCTGRPDRLRAHTEAWLYLNNLPLSKLLMRKDKDTRQDTVIKPELIANEMLTTDNVEFILEDRNCVVKKWRELGFKVLQVAEGDY